MAKLKVTLINSTIGRVVKQQATVKALGLKKIGSEVIVEDNAAMRGMVSKVSHLVKVEEVE